MRTIQLRLRLAAVATMFLGVAPTVANAQTTIYSTFGPGDTYDIGGSLGSLVVYPPYPAFPLSGGQYAAGFLFSGPTGYVLSGLRFPAAFRFGPIDVTFLVGPTMGTATPIDSWVLPADLAAPLQIYSFVSTSTPLLIPGQDYWLMLSPASSSGQTNWMVNNQGFTGLEFETPGTTNWSHIAGATTPAFDVSANLSSTVTPEPATMTLFATGLVGIVGAGLRRRRK